MSSCKTLFRGRGSHGGFWDRIPERGRGSFGKGSEGRPQPGIVAPAAASCQPLRTPVDTRRQSSANTPAHTRPHPSTQAAAGGQAGLVLLGHPRFSQGLQNWEAEDVQKYALLVLRDFLQNESQRIQTGAFRAFSAMCRPVVLTGEVATARDSSSRIHRESHRGAQRSRDA